jgi:hypothetical protein
MLASSSAVSPLQPKAAELEMLRGWTEELASLVIGVSSAVVGEYLLLVEGLLLLTKVFEGVGNHHEEEEAAL